MMWDVIEFGSTVAEIVLIIDFITRFFGFRSKEKRWLKFLGCSALMLLNGMYTVQLTGSEIALAGVNLLIIIVYSVLFLKGTVFEKLFVSFFVLIAILVINTAVLTLFGAVIDADFAELSVMRNSARALLLFTTKFLFFLATRLMLRLKRRSVYLLSIREWAAVLGVFIVTFTVGAMMFEAVLKKDYSDMTLTVFVAGLLLVNIITYILLCRISADNARKTELALLELQLSEQEGRAIETNEMYREILQIRHDMKKCLNCAEVLLSQGKYGEAEKYLSDISEEKLGTIKEFVTLRSSIVSAVINAKLSQCRREGITINISVSDCMDGIPETDISILLANLFDNAIEACRRVEGDRYVTFKIDRYMGYARILMVNPVGGDAHSGRADNLRTTKKDKKHHGFGIKTIKEICGKHNGICNLNVQDNEFRADIWIGLQD